MLMALIFYLATFHGGLHTNSLFAAFLPVLISVPNSLAEPLPVQPCIVPLGPWLCWRSVLHRGCNNHSKQFVAVKYGETFCLPLSREPAI